MTFLWISVWIRLGFRLIVVGCSFGVRCIFIGCLLFYARWVFVVRLLDSRLKFVGHSLDVSLDVRRSMLNLEWHVWTFV